MRQLIIGERTLTDDDVFIIAEIGSNHQGDAALCERMIIKAAECGVDAVKLQKRDNKAMFTKEALTKPYENENSFGKTYGEHRANLDWFGKDEFIRFKNIAEEFEVMLFATPFEESSADFLHDVGMDLWKIASCDVTNIPLVKKVARYGQPLIISTGGASESEICELVNAISPINDNFALLHCVSTYPNTDENINLRVIESLKRSFPYNLVGFSSHHPSIIPLYTARAIGASIFEVHFTLNRAAKGTDNSFSLEPQGLRKICHDLKRINPMLGSAEKRVLPEEKEGFIKKMGKSVYVKWPIKANTVIKKTDLCVKSPAGGIKPSELDHIAGKVAINDLSTGVPVKEGDYR
jgi:sialic acid synthase